MKPIKPGHRRFDDDLDLDVELEEELVDALDDPPTEEAPVPPPPAPPPRFVVHPSVVTVLEIGAPGAFAGAAEALAALVDALVAADAADPGDEGTVALATAIDVHGAWLTLVTPAEVDEVPTALERHARLASQALADGLKARLVLRGAVAWGDVASGPGLLVGTALDEARAWQASVDHVGVLLAPSAVLAASGAGAPEPAGWWRDGDRVVLRWCEDARALERSLAALGRFGEADLARNARTLAVVRSFPPAT